MLQKYNYRSYRELVCQNTRTEILIQVSLLLFLYSHHDSIFLAQNVLLKHFGIQNWSQCVGFWFLSLPPAPHLHFPGIFWRKAAWNILQEISRDSYLCQWSSGIHHCETFIVPLSSILTWFCTTGNDESRELFWLISGSNVVAFGEKIGKKKKKLE